MNYTYFLKKKKSYCEATFRLLKTLLTNFLCDDENSNNTHKF